MVKNKRSNKSRDIIHQLMDYVSTFLHNFGCKLNLPNSLVVLFIVIVVVIICSGTWSKISPVRSVIAVCSTDPKFIGTLWCTIFGIV